MKKSGEMTTREVAITLGVSERSVRRWAQDILSGKPVQPRGAEKVLRTARRDLAGFYYLRKNEVSRLGVID